MTRRRVLTGLGLTALVLLVLNTLVRVDLSLTPPDPPDRIWVSVPAGSVSAEPAGELLQFEVPVGDRFPPQSVGFFSGPPNYVPPPPTFEIRDLGRRSRLVEFVFGPMRVRSFTYFLEDSEPATRGVEVWMSGVRTGIAIWE